jgi:hypothetical protein
MNDFNMMSQQKHSIERANQSALLMMSNENSSKAHGFSFQNKEEETKEERESKTPNQI